MLKHPTKETVQPFTAYSKNLQIYLFSMYTAIGLSFLAVYAILQFQIGQYGLGVLYIIVAVLIGINCWLARFHHKITLATNIFASLGPIVLLPWQITGGLANTGLLWFTVFIVFVMLFVPGRGGTFWVLATYCLSLFLLWLQLQGIILFPFSAEEMFHFYFVGAVTYVLLFFFLRFQQIKMDLLKLELRAARRKETGYYGIGHWSWDLGQDQVHWSDQLYKIFGIQKGKPITYTTYLGWSEPEDRVVIEKTVEEACKDHEPYSLIHRVKRGDGTTMWLHVLGEVLCDNNNKPIQMIGTAQDITDRIRKNKS